MIKRPVLLLSLLVLSVTSLFSVRAHADTLSLIITTPVQTITAGSTVSFFATVSAPITNTTTLNLVSDVIDKTGDSFTFDDDGFYFGFPLTLSAGESYTGLLFTATANQNIGIGLYPGIFSILGGTQETDQDVLARANFELDVPASAVPEPGSILLLMTGLPGVAVLVRSKRHLFLKSNG
jgi:hypothetical protein